MPAILLVLALVIAAVAATRGLWSPCGLSMLSSLNPVSESARGHRFWVTTLWYLAGAAAGGAVLGAGLAIAASGVGRIGLGQSTTWAIVLAAALLAVASDTRIVGRSLPDHPRQVDERWLVKYRRWIYAGGYGLQIGTGFATYIMTAAVYLTAVLAVVTGSAGEAFAVGLTFGVVRGLAIVVTAGARTPERLRSAHRRLEALAGPSLLVAVAASAGVAVAAATALGGAIAGAAVLVGCAAAGLVSRRVAVGGRG